MVTNQKPTGRAMSMSAGLTIGAIVSMLITLVAALILAKMLDSQKLAWENVGYGVMVLLLIASVGGAMTASRKIKRRRLLVCMSSGAIYLCLLLSITALFFGGQYDAVGVTALLVLGGSGSVAMLGTGGKRKYTTKRLH